MSNEIKIVKNGAEVAKVLERFFQHPLKESLEEVRDCSDKLTRSYFKEVEQVFKACASAKNGMACLHRGLNKSSLSQKLKCVDHSLDRFKK